ncbi:MAG: hypothetical protein KAR06_08385, partial [Deltaproteobacteria bacterium]|nr:hypothetical protein [Deltaproteobacteria bacterium]
MDHDKNTLTGIAKSCSFLYDREGFKKVLLTKARDIFGVDAIALGNKKGLGFEATAINIGYPIESVIDYCNLNHDRREYLLEEYNKGMHKRGYFSVSTSGVNLKEKNPEDFNNRYTKRGIKDVVQTNFFNSKDELMGAVAFMTKTKEAFTNKELEAMDSIAPYLYYAFRKFKYLIEKEFFNTGSFDELFIGVLTADKNNIITYTNTTGEIITGLSEGSTLPPYLMDSAKKLEADCTFTGEVNLAFREITSHSPAGDILCMNLDEPGSTYLPFESEGRLFIIDPST